MSKKIAREISSEEKRPFHLHPAFCKASDFLSCPATAKQVAYGEGWQPNLIYIATTIILGFGSLGVFDSMRQGKKLKCACMGNILDEPLSTVTLAEDLGIAAMAAGMLFLG